MQRPIAHTRETARATNPRLFAPVPVVALTLGLAFLLTLIGCDGAESTSTTAPATTASAPPNPVRDREGPRGPNVVLITLDTVRADALGVYGQTRPTSPVLDRLAREGVLFEQAVSAAPSTLPSHASIMTGLFPFAHGARSNSGYALSREVETLAEVLREHGYRTGAEIAAPVINATTQLDQGFEHYQDLTSTQIEKVGGLAHGADGTTHRVDLEERDATDISRWGIRFIEQHAQEPFFLWLHFFDPHLRYASRPQYDALIPDSRYHAEIRHVDTEIGKVIREIEQRGLRTNTLVVVVADHGEGLGEHDESTHSHYVYDSTIHVPLVFWGPADIFRSEPIPSLARTVDIAPTILDYLDLPNLPGAQGTSLLPEMRGAAADPNRSAYGESIEIMRLVGGSPLRYLRRGSWKYIHKPNPELYDLANDPHERNNLAAAQPEKLRELRAALEELIANAPRSPSDAAVTMSAEDRDRLRALGYLAETVEREDLDDALASTALRGPDPNEISADVEIYSKALGLADTGKPEEALAMLEPLVERYPDSAEILSADAGLLLTVGENERARDMLSKIVEITPCSVWVHQQLGEALRRLQATDESDALLRRGALECPDQFVLLNNYAYALATDPDPARRDGEEALRLAERALQLAGGESPEILDTVAAAHAATGDYGAATVALRRALALARGKQGPPALQHHLAAQLERYESARRAAADRAPAK
jgi:arylsulfatase A-like enzyme/Flp pilus assembly protein TadD